MPVQSHPTPPLSVDMPFIRSLLAQFSHLPQDELIRKSLVYATLYWSLFCENVVRPYVPSFELTSDLEKAARSVTTDAGERVDRWVDTEVFRAHLAVRQRNIDILREAMGLIDELGLSERRSNYGSPDKASPERLEQGKAKQRAGLPEDFTSPMAHPMSPPSHSGSTSSSSLPANYRHRSRSKGLEPETPRVLHAKSLFMRTHNSPDLSSESDDEVENMLGESMECEEAVPVLGKRARFVHLPRNQTPTPAPGGTSRPRKRSRILEDDGEEEEDAPVPVRRSKRIRACEVPQSSKAREPEKTKANRRSTRLGRSRTISLDLSC